MFWADRLLHSDNDIDEDIVLGLRANVTDILLYTVSRGSVGNAASTTIETSEGKASLQDMAEFTKLLHCVIPILRNCHKAVCAWKAAAFGLTRHTLMLLLNNGDNRK
jgi:hypothetical protein